MKKNQRNAIREAIQNLQTALGEYQELYRGVFKPNGEFNTVSRVRVVVFEAT